EELAAEVNVRRHPASVALEAGDHGAVGRRAPGETGQGYVSGVAAVEAGHGTNQRTMVHALGHHGQKLTDLQAGHAGRDWAIGAAGVARRRRLGVEGLQLAGATFEEDEDARGFRTSPGTRVRTRIGAQGIGQRQAKHAESPDLEELTAVEPLTVLRQGVADSQHCWKLPLRAAN